MLDVRRMRVLREVARRGSISAAAQALSYTASAVSQQVTTLEREVGVALVERGPRSITLTDAGRALTEHAEVILQRLELAETEVLAIAGLQGGRLRLASFRSAGETLLAEAMREFARRHPKVEVTLSEGEPEDYLSAVRTGELDLGMTFQYDTIPMAANEGLELTLLVDDPMDLALPLDHPLAASEAVDLHDLAQERWIASTPRSSVHAFTANVCRDVGFEPEVAFETDDYHVLQAFVARGAGVAFLPRLSARTLHPGVALRPVRGHQPARRVYAAHRVGGAESPTVAAMIAILLDAGAGRLASGCDEGSLARA